ncbi:MAG TPA: histidine--tRNA ligase [Vicinamibacterales bacterium]|nr:histidine--tRNA ligase [Vicinamibacterales bacterium]
MARSEPARGMRDFLPEDVRRREYVIGIIKRVYERYGFEPLETPAVENLETLLGKYGEEGNQLIFKILKRGEHEASGQADLALRYDLTVPLARVIAHHQSKLPRLFKRYQIQPVWRADRPARGRFREFYQCDVDALGSTSPVVEAELCGAVSEALIELGFNDFTIRLNDRNFLTAILRAVSIPDALHATALVAVDKLDKIGVDGVKRELAARGVTEQATEVLLRVLHAGSQPAGRVTESISVLDETGVAAGSFEKIAAIINLTVGTPAEGKVVPDFSLARGLSYYTGAIMEIQVPDLAGSLGGGGRYDNLVGMFLGQSIPASGFSLGLERILVVMGERGMFPPALASIPADVMVAVFDSKDVSHALAVAARLRAAGLRVLVYPDADKIGKQIKYADSRGIPFVAILGSDEISAGTVTVKHLAGNTQSTYDQSAAGAAILEVLKRRG